MALWFRSCDSRWPFLWESADQPPGRWHAAGRGPAHYLADTPDGAWAEFLRHEEITDPADLEGIERGLWAVEVDETVETIGSPILGAATLTGGLSRYRRCQREAERLRSGGATALRAPSAALKAGGARGQRVAGGFVEAGDRDGVVLVLFGRRPQLRGWSCGVGRPHRRLLPLVRRLRSR